VCTVDVVEALDLFEILTMLTAVSALPLQETQRTCLDRVEIVLVEPRCRRELRAREPRQWMECETVNINDERVGGVRDQSLVQNHGQQDLAREA
jgi:hypothetical protein